ncbi:N-acetylmuramoyl-L-alanine amidase [Providencia vermicola]|uniref:N-acetylmuramoyl-L-alanine amidase n=2 Tax=Providencia TaxID=586 RepID=A0AAI9I1X4_PROST|nr:MULTISPECIES: N-acetylmuramoyl-L-alanine amidase [Providencia]ELR5044887.1 N-acetylmuramoyl-L-alanine amidase [Providencia rettgeri]ELR5037142.1 N-acetylmuramoyl-L-alanine amidase [Providencia stuartii]ELR5122977.1 N-acetylmuramoyl-L-alanine amidase [Providencia stuartii]ELR5144235.1 N-acetylmuramoyl-L-alanine amidase [Providencia stuartii]ELR5293280.1 N-acetylmuramoyl-L-alanine amidase [Providencia stuartii]
MTRNLLILFVFIISGCSTLSSRQGYYVDTSYPSRNTSERVQYVVLHYTVSNDDYSIYLLTKGQVSSHYLIPSQPTQKDNQPVVLQLVPEELKAWHAGDSHWRYHSGLNDISIGIEIVNAGFSVDKKGNKTWAPFNQSQISALIPLVKDIMQRYNIPAQNIVGHSDIAPLRKEDPGRAFPWETLAKQGIGAWPDAATVTNYLSGRSAYEPGNVLLLQKALRFYGYAEVPLSGQLDAQTQKIIRAFQMHFRPRNIEGKADAETEAIALALIEKYRDMSRFLSSNQFERPQVQHVGD